MKYLLASFLSKVRKICLLSICFFLAFNWALADNLFLSQVGKKLKNIPQKGVKYRLLKEYGALWLNNDSEAILPPSIAFSSAHEAQTFQAGLKLKTIDNCTLQEAAYKALKEAQKLAQSKNLSIRPRGADSCLRSYELTHKLWLSRVEPNLAYYVKLGKLKAPEAQNIKALSIWEQVDSILKLEKEKGLSFDKYRQGSILNSVAAPGSSQHLSGLAFDIAEYNNPQVRQIMNNYGWFQTVQNDLPHFTYLGKLQESQLESLGLKKIVKNQFIFWIPNLEN